MTMQESGRATPPRARGLVIKRVALGLLLAFTTLAHAAPAPFPPTERGRNGEVVFLAGSANRTKLALVYLRSPSLLRKLAQTEAVARCTPDLNAEQRADWLAQRLTV